jgi:2-polyprenyl-3-methyl-5-hydroxy-6-metoxy-1,4-benzoquinol methylase
MKRIVPQNDWPASWSKAYRYDLQEVYGEISNRGLAHYYRNRSATAIKLIADVLPIGSSILDVAAAQGNFTLLLAERGYRVTWNDLRSELESYVRLKHEKGSVTFAPGNVFDADFKDRYDAVLVSEIIEHVAHPDEFLRRISTIVKPGGYVVMTTPNGAYLRNKLPRFSACADPSAFESVQFQPDSDGHIFLLWPDEIEKLARDAGLILDELQYFTTPLTNGHPAMESVLRFTPTRIVAFVESLMTIAPTIVRQRLLMHTAARFRTAS